jgi:hypothetical protein
MEVPHVPMVDRMKGWGLGKGFGWGQRLFDGRFRPDASEVLLEGRGEIVGVAEHGEKVERRFGCCFVREIQGKSKPKVEVSFQVDLSERRLGTVVSKQSSPSQYT